MAQDAAFIRDSALARAVLAIGQASFATEMVASLEAVAPVDHIMVFSLRSDMTTECLANAGAIAIAHDLGDAYSSHYHRFDPNMDAIFAPHQDSRPVHMRFAERRAYPASYRRIFFERAGIVDKFATALWHADRCFYVNFYRIARSGRFTPADLARLERSSPIVAAATVRHCELRVGPRRESLPQETLPLSHRLDALFARTEGLAALSRREREICIKILMGLSSEAIASALGLSHSTVLTYRRRAYERLGIGSQNELFARVFALTQV